MSNRSNKLLLIIGISSFALPLLFNGFLNTRTINGQDLIDSIIHDGFNHILRAIIFFILFEPISLLWKKFISKKETPKWFSKEFFEDEIETFFVFWLLTTLLFLPGYSIYYWFK